METNETAQNNSTSAEMEMLRFVFAIESILVPLLIIIGLFGNTGSAIVFFQPNLRQTSCSLYLGARAISDICFLMFLFIIWLYNMDVSVFALPGMCKVEVFLSYLCAFLSVWFVVWVTVENYYRICRPFKISTFCTVKKARIVIVVTILTGCAFYSVSVITTTSYDYKGRPTCSSNGYTLVNKVLSNGDSLVTMVLPSVVIILTMARITYSLVLSCRRQASGTGKSSGGMQTKVTRLLFCVSVVFLLLNLPSHIIRSKLIVDSLLGNKTNMTPANYLLQHLCQQISYASFSVNFFLYLSLGESFRHTWLKLFCKFLWREGNIQQNSYNLVSTHGKARAVDVGKSVKTAD